MSKLHRRARDRDPYMRTAMVRHQLDSETMRKGIAKSSEITVVTLLKIF